MPQPISDNDFFAHVLAFKKALGLTWHKDDDGLLRIEAKKNFAIPFLKEAGGFVRLDTPGNTEGMIATGLDATLGGNSPEPPSLHN